MVQTNILDVVQVVHDTGCTGQIVNAIATVVVAVAGFVVAKIHSATRNVK